MAAETGPGKEFIQGASDIAAAGPRLRDQYPAVEGLEGAVECLERIIRERDLLLKRAVEDMLKPAHF